MPAGNRDKFPCPKCGHRKSKVKNMNTGSENPYDYKGEYFPRWRECLKCGEVYETREVAWNIQKGNMLKTYCNY